MIAPLAGAQYGTLRSRDSSKPREGVGLVGKQYDPDRDREDA